MDLPVQNTSNALSNLGNDMLEGIAHGLHELNQRSENAMDNIVRGIDENRHYCQEYTPLDHLDVMA